MKRPHQAATNEQIPVSATPTFHIKTCRNCEGKDPCTCSIGHNHAFSCCNAGRVTLGPMDGHAPPGDE